MTSGPAGAGPLLIVAAHPDDEVIGAAGLLARRREAGDVTVVHITDGAPRNLLDVREAGFVHWQAYAEARRRELDAALALAGIGADRRLELGVPDQGAAHALELIARRLCQVLVEHAGALILTHAFEGGHPDHDAVAFAAHAARALYARTAGTGGPPLAEFTSYHAGPDGLAIGVFLPVGGPAGGAADDAAPAEVLVLGPAERRLREAMLDCFATQARTLDPFRDRTIERYRAAPAYRFTEPPHPGRLFYEHFDWGTTGVRWRELARAALAALDLQEPL